MTRVIIDDLRTAGVGTCKQAREWFERNDLNWRDFKGNGLDAEVLRAKQDGASHITKVIAAAEEREAQNGR